MASEQHTPTLADLPKARVVVVGDWISDVWAYGRVDRISPEAPVPVFLQERVEIMPGGAGNVAANLEALGCFPTLLTDRGNGSPRKTRYVVGGHQLLRVDDEVIRPIVPAVADDIFRQATMSPLIGALVLSDYGKGMFLGRLTQRLIQWARGFGIPVIVDPKGADWSKYAGASVITPNEAEWAAMDGAGSIMDGRTSVLETKGAKGMRLLFADGPTLAIPATAREVFDVTGAGDTVVAVLAAALAVGYPLVDAARIANRAAGIVVGKRGTATCSLAELEAAR
jgi:D-beta-D-heptose 7-phosphate kinase/D-beta-D-heptose 1-phosphate adenosyltransferase